MSIISPSLPYRLSGKRVSLTVQVSVNMRNHIRVEFAQHIHGPVPEYPETFVFNLINTVYLSDNEFGIEKDLHLPDSEGPRLFNPPYQRGIFSYIVSGNANIMRYPALFRIPVQKSQHNANASVARISTGCPVTEEFRPSVSVSKQTSSNPRLAQAGTHRSIHINHIFSCAKSVNDRTDSFRGIHKQTRGKITGLLTEDILFSQVFSFAPGFFLGLITSPLYGPVTGKNARHCFSL